MLSTAAIAVITTACVFVVVVAIVFVLRLRILYSLDLSLCNCGPSHRHRYLRCCSESNSRHQRKRTRDRKREAIQRLDIDEVMRKLRGSRASRNYAYACEYRDMHPIDESKGNIVGEELEYVIEHGASAWVFAPSVENTGVTINSGIEIEFSGEEQSLISNLQFPNEQRVYYFEVRLDELPENTNVAVGIAMKSYPPLRMAGWAKNSVAYHTANGVVYYSHPLDSCRKCPRAHTSDTIGVGWRPRSGKMFFAINGAIVCHVRTPWIQNRLYPIVSADGPCKINVNVGTRAFVLSHANMRYWGLGPPEGARPPPPLYHHASESMLLDAASYQEGFINDSHSTLIPMPPSYGDSRQHSYTRWAHAKDQADSSADDDDGLSIVDTTTVDADGYAQIGVAATEGYAPTRQQPSPGLYIQSTISRGSQDGAYTASHKESSDILQMSPFPENSATTSGAVAAATVITADSASQPRSRSGSDVDLAISDRAPIIG
ncbi:Protein ssh4 [Coemansia sp. RSA 2703]|nr:Protein ssh4 [Coemansia sp. RSA 2703]KAJ2375074.1 Protein ssh4 [Coemansia sp. RSA 2607]KAJ2397727.1 Protein ssh4 [Coemansia sp. RSA 2603]